MSSRELHVALISGGMYDTLYAALPEFTRATGVHVSIDFRGIHSALNAHLGGLKDVPYDLVSTHTKYAPSQMHLLAALPEDDAEDFYGAILSMARIEGKLYGVPRNIDAKLLHYRTDLVSGVPRDWDELCTSARELSGSGQYGFVFTGRDSGLFGMFFELAEMGGARLFPEDGRPRLRNDGGRWALQTIRKLYKSGAAPQEVKAWQFDSVHDFFREGRAAMVCDWPGFYSSYCAEDSKVRGRFGVARMPAGPLGVHRAYAGAHTFALTKRGVEETAAHELLRFLTSPAQQSGEAKQGSVPVRRSMMNEIRAGNAERWGLLEQVISNDTLIPPRLSYYPEIEEILWQTVQAAMTGAMEIEASLCEMEERITDCHQRHAQAEGQHAS